MTEIIELPNKILKNNPGYIDAHTLDELWFHTGTACNLACPFCLEGSKPGDNRLQRMNIEDVIPYVDEAVSLGVKQFSFTGGEPFIVKDFIKILDYASKRKPCLVLTNGTEPLIKRIETFASLKENPNPIHFRISLDYPDPEKHDISRGVGSFHKALHGIELLIKNGFTISIARQMEKEEDKESVEQQYRTILKNNNLPTDIPIVEFPDFLKPGSIANVPTITENCLIDYHTEETRKKFMCAYSKMLIKRKNKIRVYACTLVDDDPSYDMGNSLAESMTKRVLLNHHRCYSCFAFGASCSEA
ncbi:MAG: hypothetical protein DHS20C09_07680 [marine bacterium B5-7]|nr:MAG: hypothetical protein DHS20C09_07680 [marine bacterium B5-7]